MRLLGFIQLYQDRISETMFRKFAVEKSETVFSIFEKELPFTLPWSHYLQLMRIKDENERKFYEIEATNEAWGIRTYVLQRCSRKDGNAPNMGKGYSNFD